MGRTEYVEQILHPVKMVSNADTIVDDTVHRVVTLQTVHFTLVSTAHRKFVDLCLTRALGV